MWRGRAEAPLAPAQGLRGSACPNPSFGSPLFGVSSKGRDTPKKKQKRVRINLDLNTYQEAPTHDSAPPGAEAVQDKGPSGASNEPQVRSTA